MPSAAGMSHAWGLDTARTRSSQKATASGVSSSRRSGRHAVQYRRLCAAACMAGGMPVDIFAYVSAHISHCQPKNCTNGVLPTSVIAALECTGFTQDLHAAQYERRHIYSSRSPRSAIETARCHPGLTLELGQPA